MPPAIRFLAILPVLPFFTNCGTETAATTAVVTGPFDKRGDYVEDWADSPDKWANPPASSTKKTPPPLVTLTPPPSRSAPVEPVPLVQLPPSRPIISQPAPVVVVKPLPASDASPAPARKLTPKPTPKPTPKLKPTPTPKPKPAPEIRHTVKKGEFLSRIASKYSVTLSALRRANGIKGDLIRPGQVLKIPK